LLTIAPSQQRIVCPDCIFKGRRGCREQNLEAVAVGGLRKKAREGTGLVSAAFDKFLSSPVVSAQLASCHLVAPLPISTDLIPFFDHSLLSLAAETRGREEEER